MRKGLRGIWCALAASVMLLGMLILPRGAFADADVARHSVVVIEAGWLINGEWMPMPELKEKHAYNYDPDNVKDFVYNAKGELNWVHPRGTAFFVGKQGENPQYLITNHHVIDYYIYWKAGQRNTFTYEDGNTTVLKSSLRMYYDNDTYDEVYYVDTDESMDLSILRLDLPTDQRVPLVISDPVDASDVRAIGFPGLSDNHFAASVTRWGEKDATITSGVVSKLYTESGNGRRMIQTDAIVSPGSSGGALLDGKDRVVGVTTEMISDADTSVYYAVSMEMVRPMLDMHNIPYDYERPEEEPEPVDENTSSTVRVIWSDSDNAEGKRPSELVATLSNGQTVVLNDGNAWTQTVSDLPRAGEDGTEINYTWSIPAIEGYESKDPVASGTTTAFTFTHEVKPGPNIALIGGVGAIVAAAAGGIGFFVHRRMKDSGRYDDGLVDGDAGAANGVDANGGAGGVDPQTVNPGRGFDLSPDVKLGQIGQRIRNDSGYRVQGVSGTQQNKRYALPSSGKVVIGRDKDCGIVIPSGTPGVSGKHCEVWYENGRVFVRDLGSKYHTYVEPGTELTANQDYELAQNQTFWLADKNERFQIVVKRG